ncbi:hypothetical protein EVAR_6323_1 [Eumeta japonica]|uniref:ATP-dependent DNA helicase n=1 Tax=Eumeta variegata TaxID=151549 RepID=A0A4C1T9D2_EUMVA|nr:hypothetical protein EVAR_6323_1 [Eumeta japonica]
MNILDLKSRDLKSGGTAAGALYILSRLAAVGRRGVCCVPINKNEQRVFFTENDIQAVLNNLRDTILTAFFKFCAQDDFAKTYKTFFTYLRNEEGDIYNPYQATCKDRGFLEDDSHWENTLSEAAISTGKIALAVASSRIAATLLEGGRTAHETFKLPLKITIDDVNNICSISKQSYMGKLMRDFSLIFWDEATTSNKTSVEILDRTIRDLRSKNSPMGRYTILFSVRSSLALSREDKFDPYRVHDLNLDFIGFQRNSAG